MAARVAVVGAGGVGGYLAVLLAATAEVYLVDTGAHLAALRERGITVRSRARGELSARLPATGEPATIGPVDLVLYCVKTYDNDAAIPRLRPLLGPETAVLTVQNGIGNVERLAAAYGPEMVVGGALVGGGTRVAPGIVEHVLPTDAESLEIGPLVVGGTQRADVARSVLAATGIRLSRAEAIEPVLWTKLLGMAALAGVGCLTRTATAGWRDHQAARSLYATLVREAAATAEAEGITLDEATIASVLGQPDRLGPAHRTSMQADLERGQRLEVDAIQGEVVRRADRRGVAAPVYGAVYAVLRHADETAKENEREREREENGRESEAPTGVVRPTGA